MTTEKLFMVKQGCSWLRGVAAKRLGRRDGALDPALPPRPVLPPAGPPNAPEPATPRLC